MTTHQPEYVRQHGPLEVPLRHVRLHEQIAELKSEETWERGEARVAKTLVKEHGLSVVLMALHAGTTVPEHQAAGAVTVHCLEGRVLVATPERQVEIGSGDMVALDGRVPHGVTAREESALLVTLAH